MIKTGRILFAYCLAVVAMPAALPLASLHGDEPLPGGHYTFTGVEVFPIERTKADAKINDHKSDVLTHWIRFDFHPEFVIKEGTESKPFTILNPTVASKSRMTLDKPIKFKGENVPAGTNLLKYKKFDGSFFNVSMPNRFPLAIHSARIMSDFELPADTYTVNFEWATDRTPQCSGALRRD